MAFGIYSLLEAAVLVLNAVCVLNEERFLSKLPGWGGSHVQGFGEEPGIKTQIFHFIRSIKTVMKYPLIPLNIFIILFKLIFG
ncbi:immediate early response 3-interacting protein 1-like [Eriocheir sinensis]|uniref:immediate early response 3-interacting protein 1-like n=1 Tax=Eriocheir sinensis TaxID=95602 RepID=UPI0021C717FB|nr:immediate early response 3-interacting protein 1-like [Eriocheir sinensis]